jgi:hypothetical protein
LFKLAEPLRDRSQDSKAAQKQRFASHKAIVGTFASICNGLDIEVGIYAKAKGLLEGTTDPAQGLIRDIANRFDAVRQNMTLSQRQRKAGSHKEDFDFSHVPDDVRDSLNKLQPESQSESLSASISNILAAIDSVTLLKARPCLSCTLPSRHNLVHHIVWIMLWANVPC